MKGFIEVTTPDGKKNLINISMIIYAEPSKSSTLVNCRIVLVDRGVNCVYQETYEEVLKLIQAAQ